jgi:hypothetical protein
MAPTRRLSLLRGSQDGCSHVLSFLGTIRGRTPFSLLERKLKIQSSRIKYSTIGKSVHQFTIAFPFLEPPSPALNQAA